MPETSKSNEQAEQAEQAYRTLALQTTSHCSWENKARQPKSKPNLSTLDNARLKQAQLNHLFVLFFGLSETTTTTHSAEMRSHFAPELGKSPWAKQSNQPRLDNRNGLENETSLHGREREKEKKKKK